MINVHIRAPHTKITKPNPRISQRPGSKEHGFEHSLQMQQISTEQHNSKIYEQKNSNHTNSTWIINAFRVTTKAGLGTRFSRLGESLTKLGKIIGNLNNLWGNLL